MTHVSVFHIGPQKTGTTWLYRCFKEHPEIIVPFKDKTHFYDLNWTKNEDWYTQQFPRANPKSVILDPTPSYFRNPLAPQRIHEYNPTAKIIICVREPITRAFSHYWHEKRKKSISYGFEDVLGNYDLYCSWIETGFYAYHIERYLEYFDRKQILVQFFDLLENDPQKFFIEACDFIGISSDFLPSIINVKVNEGIGLSRAKSVRRLVVIREYLEKLKMQRTVAVLQSLWDLQKQLVSRQSDSRTERDRETIHDVNRNVVSELQQIYRPWNLRLSEVLGQDLPKTWLY